MSANIAIGISIVSGSGSVVSVGAKITTARRGENAAETNDEGNAWEYEEGAEEENEEFYEDEEEEYDEEIEEEEEYDEEMEEEGEYGEDYENEEYEDDAEIEEEGIARDLVPRAEAFLVATLRAGPSS